MSAGDRPTGWTHSSEPQPVTQNGSGDASKRACSPARRRSPRSLTAARASASTSSVATTAPTAIVNALLLNVPAWLSPPRAGSNVRHQVGATAEGAERQPAAEVLAERRHVGRDAEQLLGAADAEARRHHLVEDQHRAVRRSSARRSAARNAGSPGMQPPEPCIGSTSTHGDVVAVRRRTPPSAAATSLYGSTT